MWLATQTSALVEVLKLYDKIARNCRFWLDTHRPSPEPEGFQVDIKGALIASFDAVGRMVNETRNARHNLLGIHLNGPGGSFSTTSCFVWTNMATVVQSFVTTLEKYDTDGRILATVNPMALGTVESETFFRLQTFLSRNHGGQNTMGSYLYNNPVACQLRDRSRNPRTGAGVPWSLLFGMVFVFPTLPTTSFPHSLTLTFRSPFCRDSSAGRARPVWSLRAPPSPQSD